MLPRVSWDEEKDGWLKGLATSGKSGSEIANWFSARLGFPVSEDAIFHRSSELGVALKGRAGALAPSETPADPFSEPSWLKRELAKDMEPSERERPFKGVIVGLDEEVSEGELSKRVQEAYLELWAEYVRRVVDSGRATSEQAKQALKKVPQWFKRWARVPVIRMWDPDKDPENPYLPKSKVETENLDKTEQDRSSDVYIDQHPTIRGSAAQKTSIPAVASATEPRGKAESASSSVGPPPVEKCRRCGGAPTWDSSLEEWVCSSCGSILRFQSVTCM